MSLVTKRVMDRAIQDAQKPEHPRRLDYPGGGSFSGRAWVGNKPKITVDENEAGSTRFLYLLADGSGYTWATSMPNTQPADGVVYDLDETYGDIHLTGNIAPGG